MDVVKLNRKHGTSITHTSVTKLLESYLKNTLEVLQITREVVEDLPPMITAQQVSVLPRIPQKVYHGCLQKMCLADRVSTIC